MPIYTVKGYSPIVTTWAAAVPALGAEPSDAVGELFHDVLPVSVHETGAAVVDGALPALDVMLHGLLAAPVACSAQRRVVDAAALDPPARIRVPVLGFFLALFLGLRRRRFFLIFALVGCMLGF